MERSRTTSQQFAIIIEFMERNGDIGRPSGGPRVRIRAEELWEQLSDMLNSIDDGVQKTSDKWKKVWADWKSKTKTKVRNMRNRARGIGNGSGVNALTALEERVAGLLGEVALPGLLVPIERSCVQDQELENVSQSVKQEVEDNDEAENSASSGLRTPSPGSETRPTSATAMSDEYPEVSFVAVASSSGQSPTRAPEVPSPRMKRPRLDASPQSTARQQPSPPPRRQRLAASPSSAAGNSRPHLQRRQMLSSQPSTSEFAAIEMRRLQLEHEREMRRIEMDQERNQLLYRLVDIAQTFVEAYTARHRSA